MANARQMMCDVNCGSMQLFLRDCGLNVLNAAAAAPAIYIFLYVLSLSTVATFHCSDLGSKLVGKVLHRTELYI